MNDIGATIQILKSRTNGELDEAKRLSDELSARKAAFQNALYSEFLEEEAKPEAEISQTDVLGPSACTGSEGVSQQ